jgi:CRISPR-associated endonuclease Csy4
VLASSESLLQQLNLTKWLHQLADYVHCTAIREVPSNREIKHRQYRRQHMKGSIEKLARRRAKRHNTNLEEAMTYYQGKLTNSDLPYIQLKSLTTRQPFRLYIERHEYNELVQDGFGTYGLSNTSTVPEF